MESEAARKLKEIVLGAVMILVRHSLRRKAVKPSNMIIPKRPAKFSRTGASLEVLTRPKEARSVLKRVAKNMLKWLE